MKIRAAGLFFAFLFLVFSGYVFGKLMEGEKENSFSDEVIELEKSAENTENKTKNREKQKVKNENGSKKNIPEKKERQPEKTVTENKEVISEKTKISVLLQKIKEKQKTRKAMETDILIKSSYPGSGAAREIKGDVLIKKKDKFRVHYTTPNEQYLISDGKTLWIYTPALNQVIKQAADTAELNTNFYIEIENSMEYFVKNSRTQLNETGDTYEFIMRPEDRKTLDFDKITVKIDKKTLVPEYMSMEFDGTLMEVYFSGVKNYSAKEAGKTEKFADSNFIFKTPEGAQEIEASSFFGQ